MSRALFVPSALCPLPLFLLALPGLAQTTWYVDAEACPGPGTGTALDPFCTIQDAIDASLSGDRILVLPGTYAAGFGQSVADFSGKEVLLKSTGGPAVTTLRNGFDTVLFDQGEGPDAVLEGFTITRADHHGVHTIGSSPTIRGNDIVGNFAGEGGSGLRITGGGSPLVVENRISGNICWPTSGLGGGVYVESASPTFERNEIVGNNVFADFGQGLGAGIYIKNSTVLMVGNLVARNTATDESINAGGGLYAIASTVTGVGNTFAENVAADSEPLFGITPGSGGGAFLANSVVRFADTIFWGNQATEGHELTVVGGVLDLSWTDVDGGLSEIFGNGAVNWGDGMQTVEPQTTGFPGYRLTPGSPLVDRGSPTAQLASAVDPDVEPRVLDGDLDGRQRVDMGWDEVDPTQLAVSGTPTPGATLTFQTAAPAGWNYFLAVSPGTATLRFAPYGSILLQPAGLTIFAAGTVPGIDEVPLPNDPGLVGLVANVQALAKEPGRKIGSLSRRLVLEVQ